MVLVLNRLWCPIGVVGVREAFNLLVSERGRVVCPESFELFEWGEWIGRSSSKFIRLVGDRTVGIPEVVLVGCDYTYKSVGFSKDGVLIRDGFVCQYCGKLCKRNGLTIDHVIPKCRGGVNSWANCVAACLSCNASKADRSVGEFGRPLLRKPSAPKMPLFAGALESWSKFIR